MKKMLIALSMLGLASVSYAGDLNSINTNDASVFAGITASNNTHGDKGTGFNFGVQYNSYQTDNFFIQPSVLYASSGNAYYDNYVIANLDVGYTHTFDNGMKLSPKVGIGAFHVLAVDAHDTQLAYNVGFDLAVTKKITVGFEYIYSRGSNGHFVDLTNLTVGYKF